MDKLIVKQLVDKYFAEENRESVFELLETTKVLGRTIGDRLRFAMIKMSQGNMAKLDMAIEVAQKDYRDLLLWTGFESIGSAEKWAEQEVENQK